MLCVVALVGVLPLAHVLAADAATQLIPSTQTISVGQTTTVSLHVQDVQDLYGFQVEMAFDPAVLEVVDADGAVDGVQVTLGSWLQPDFVFQNGADNGLGTIACVLSQMSPRPGVDGNGELLTITFRGVATGVSAVRFTGLTLANSDGKAIPASQQDAQVEVSGGSEPPTPTPTPTSPPPEGTVLTLRRVDVREQALVEVWVENVEGFYSVDLRLAFDPAIVQGVSVVEGPAFTDHPSQCQVTESSIVDGVVRFAGTMVCITQDGDLHLATIAFEEVSCGTSPLTWVETHLAHRDGSPIAHTAQDDSLTMSECPAEVAGRALLEGRADHEGVKVSLVDGVTQSLVTDAGGEYTFGDIPAGVYDLTLSHDLYLSATLQSCSVGPGEARVLPEVELLGGDLNGDGAIDISDLTIGGSRFNTSDPGADINGDGTVNIFDIVLIGKNFLETGPVVLACDP